MRAIARQEAERLFKHHSFVPHAQLEEIVDEAVKKTLLALGLDVRDPTEVQENFSNLRSWSAMKKAMSQGMVYALSKTVFMGLLALLVLGFYSWISGHRPPP